MSHMLLSLQVRLRGKHYFLRTETENYLLLVGFYNEDILVKTQADGITSCHLVTFSFLSSSCWKDFLMLRRLLQQWEMTAAHKLLTRMNNKLFFSSPQGRCFAARVSCCPWGPDTRCRPRPGASQSCRAAPAGEPPASLRRCTSSTWEDVFQRDQATPRLKWVVLP